MKQNTILLVKKSLDQRFIEANYSWLRAAQIKPGFDYTGLKDEDLPWGEFASITNPHEQDAINGINYGMVHYGVLEDNKDAWIYNYKYLEIDPVTEEKFLQVFAYEIVNPLWLDYLSRIRKNDPYSVERYYIGKQTKEDLTKAEQKVLFYLARGMTAKEIAIFLNQSPRTIESHVFTLKTKLNCDRKSQLIEYAFNSGYTQFLP